MWLTLSREVDASDSDIAKARRDPPFQEYVAQEGWMSTPMPVVVTLTGQVPTIDAGATSASNTDPYATKQRPTTSGWLADRTS
jgi:hypothetical protein